MEKRVIKLLLIENDLSQARRFQNILRQSRDIYFTVIHKDTLSSGLMFLNRSQPDVVLLDLSLPDDSEAELVRRIYLVNPDMPIVALVEKEDDQLAMEIIRAGAQDCLVKSYMGSTSLIRVLKYCIERKHVEGKLRRKLQDNRNGLAASSNGQLSVSANSEDHTPEIMLEQITGQTATFVNSVPVPREVGPKNAGRENIELDSSPSPLLDNGAQFHQFISSISDHIYVTKITADGKKQNLYISPNIEALTGYPHQNFQQDWCFWPDTVIHLEDRALAQSQAHHLSNGNSHEVEYRLTRADGEIIWVRDSGRVEIEGDAKIIYGVVSNITERKKAELEQERLTQELQDMNQTLDEHVRVRTAELQAILDAVGEGVVVTGLDGLIQYVNPAMEQLTGYTEEECLAETPKLWKSDQHNNTFFAQMWQTILSGQTWRGEVRNKKKDGTLYDVQLTISPIPGPGELPRGFVGVQSDITPLKEMDRIKSEFLSTAAHELRTPLTSIQGFSEILLTRSNLKDEQKKRYQTFINQQANALAAIINDLLDLTRLESGQGFEMTTTNVDLKEIIDEVLFGFRENNPKHNYQVVERETWPQIIGDPVKLAQLFKNLYSNATKYSPNGGDITLETDVQQEYNLLHLTITDQGLGMTPEQLSRIFERFYRADASNTAIGGTGLGMAISQLIVNQHQGKIWIESELHVGTTIHLLFPLQDRPQYILVIEDDVELMEMEKTILEHEGFTAMTAYEGHTGLELARSGSPNLILLDLNLPGMTGFDILDRLKENYLTENIPVIITSAMDTPEFIESAIDKGATDYLVKPYSIGDLLVRINRALTKSTNNHNEQVRVIA